MLKEVELDAPSRWLHEVLDQIGTSDLPRICTTWILNLSSGEACSESLCWCCGQDIRFEDVEEFWESIRSIDQINPSRVILTKRLIFFDITWETLHILHDGLRYHSALESTTGEPSQQEGQVNSSAQPIR